MRAMAFERLVHHDRFVSQLITRAVGALGLDRPAMVRRGSGEVQVAVTARELAKASGLIFGKPSRHKFGRRSGRTRAMFPSVSLPASP